MCFVKIKIYMKKINSKFFVLTLSLFNFSCGGDKDEEDESNSKNKELSEKYKAIETALKLTPELLKCAEKLKESSNDKVNVNPEDETSIDRGIFLLQNEYSRKEEIKRLEDLKKKLQDKKKNTK
jgi:hypothetical protein